MQAVMEIAIGGDDWEPLQDPETGSSVVTVAADDENQFDRTLREAFGRAVDDVVIHVGNSFRLRELTAEERDNEAGAR